MVPSRSDVLKQGICKVLKLAGLVFATDGKIRTGTDARGSTQTGLVLTWTAKTQNGHGCPWFQADRVGFATDGKIRTATDGGGSTQKRCFKSTNFFQVLLKLVV